MKIEDGKLVVEVKGHKIGVEIVGNDVLLARAKLQYLIWQAENQGALDYKYFCK